MFSIPSIAWVAGGAAVLAALIWGKDLWARLTSTPPPKEARDKAMPTLDSRAEHMKNSLA